MANITESIKAVFKVDLSGLKKGMRNAEGVTQKSTKRMSGAMGKFGGAITKAAGAFALFAAAGAAASYILKVNRASQKLQASLTTVTGSAEAATRAFSMIEEFAEETPYKVSQVAEGFIKLKALGLDPSERSLRSFGNTASAMGKDLQQMIEAVADASTMEFERLKEFGIKSKQEADTVSFTFQGVTKTVKKNAEAITGYLRQIGEVNFAGAMALQMKTIDGIISNIGDNVDKVARIIGGEGGVNTEVSELLIKFRDWTGSVKKNQKTITVWTNMVIQGFKLVGQSIYSSIAILINFGNLLGDIILGGIQGFIKLAEVGDKAQKVLSPDGWMPWTRWANTWDSMKDLWDTDFTFDLNLDAINEDTESLVKNVEDWVEQLDLTIGRYRNLKRVMEGGIEIKLDVPDISEMHDELKTINVWANKVKGSVEEIVKPVDHWLEGTHFMNDSMREIEENLTEIVDKSWVWTDAMHHVESAIDRINAGNTTTVKQAQDLIDIRTIENRLINNALAGVRGVIVPMGQAVTLSGNIATNTGKGAKSWQENIQLGQRMVGVLDTMLVRSQSLAESFRKLGRGLLRIAGAAIGFAIGGGPIGAGIGESVGAFVGDIAIRDPEPDREEPPPTRYKERRPDSGPTLQRPSNRASSRAPLVSPVEEPPPTRYRDRWPDSGPTLQRNNRSGARVPLVSPISALGSTAGLSGGDTFNVTITAATADAPGIAEAVRRELPKAVRNAKRKLLI